MIFHHIGIACKNIEKTIEFISKLYEIESYSPKLYDENQDAEVCLLKTKNNINIELISGNKINNLLKKNITYYHTCYLVNDIEETIKLFQENNCLIVSRPKEALLFDNKKVAFLYTPIGLIELLEE